MEVEARLLERRTLRAAGTRSSSQFSSWSLRGSSSSVVSISRWTASA